MPREVSRRHANDAIELRRTSLVKGQWLLKGDNNGNEIGY
jgi:hypothetical protein